MNRFTSVLDVKGKYFTTTNNIQKRFSSLASCLQLQWQIQGLGREGKGDLKFDSGDKFLSCFYLRALTCQELIYFKMSEFRTPPMKQLYKSCCQQNFDFRQIVKILTGLMMGGGGAFSWTCHRAWIYINLLHSHCLSCQNNTSVGEWYKVTHTNMTFRYEINLQFDIVYKDKFMGVLQRALLNFSGSSHSFSSQSRFSILKQWVKQVKGMGIEIILLPSSWLS